MVEGGMTVYAVWVGNPVLTYDTNKPNTWNGQMPSTPASVSVAYNTAAADGSGWQSGDTSKIRGYRFLGWYAGPQDDAGLYDWNTLLTGNVTVYAHWQRLQANVVYDANGGTGSHGTTTGWQYSDVTVRPTRPSRSSATDTCSWDGILKPTAMEPPIRMVRRFRCRTRTSPCTRNGSRYSNSSLRLAA